ncbi:MAG TPA: chromosomal replication initiator protein DnaA [Myxococcota bacterium]|nr:chromosomal replication initiator protein DnaA [Myxococcota bacterium]
MTTPQIWDGVLRRLGAEIPSFALEAWVRPIVARVDESGLQLSCPSAFHRERLRERFLKPILACAYAEAGGEIDVHLSIAEEGSRTAREASGAGAPPAAPTRGADAERSRPVAAPAPVQRSLSHTFETFVVGSCNALAREAALALAHGRQLGVSPLFLCSESGLGKTHLARAVAAEARREGTERVVYASSESFTSDFLSSLRAQRMPGFKRRFRQECDLLVIEDVQFLANKKSTQLELFHTIDHLLSAGVRILLTADRLPRDISEFDGRLRSQMTGGLVAEIEAPDAQVRRQILRAKAAAGGVHIPEPCLDRLVDGARGSVRDLEGVLIQLVASAALLKRTIDLELTEAALRKLVPSALAQGRPMEPEVVIQVVASHFKTTAQALASRSRRRDLVAPRQLAMYLARRYTTAPLQQIGEALGRDHPAVSHALTTIGRQILERAPLRYQVEALSARLDALAARGGSGAG